MERHQCDIQLRRRSVYRGRLRHFGHAFQYRGDRQCKSHLHAGGHPHGRSLGQAQHDADRRGRHRRHLPADGRGLSLSDRRVAHAPAGGHGHRLLCHDAGAGHVGHPFGNIPQQDQGRRHVGGYDSTLGSQFFAHLYFPRVKRPAQRLGHILVLCRHLPGGVCFYL